MARPAVILLFCIGMITAQKNSSLWINTALVLLGALTVLQIGMRKQRYPVWTQKALTLVISTVIVDTIVAFYWHSSHEVFLVLLPLLQSFTVMISWVLFWPLDTFLKTQRMEKAQKIREQFPDLTVIGVTGSVGKTTVKELLSLLLKSKKTIATPAYVNSEMGVANWILSELLGKDKDAPDILIVEMGAYRKGEIAKLSRIVQPTMGIVTFIGEQHMGLFGSKEALANAKAELLEALPENGTAFLNADNAACIELSGKAPCTVQTVGTGGHANIEAFDIEETTTGIAFRTGETNFSIPLHGTHNVTNVLLAIAVARSLEIGDAESARALAQYTPPKHTFSVRTEGKTTILDDTHNASPASFKAAIAWARTQPATQKVLLTSGLIELGTRQDHTHTKLGEMAHGVFDRVIFLHPRSGQFFEKGRGEPIEIFAKLTHKVESGSLLVCVGRVPEATVAKLLPS